MSMRGGGDLWRLSSADTSSEVGRSRRFGKAGFVGSVVLLSLTALSMSSCQERGWNYGVINRCGAAIEAWTDKSPDPEADVYTIGWKKVDPDEAKTFWSGDLEGSMEARYLWVRPAGSTAVPTPTKVALNGDTRDYDASRAYIVISGDLCPEPTS